MTPVEGAEPPKANPLAKPAASSSSSTLKLKPIERAATVTSAAGLKLPPKPGLATAGLKLPPKGGLSTAGLKLPPKPGMPTQTGLKLPPKPGLATQTGLKLPPKPGLATAGLKLPPKPGMPTQTGLKLPPKPGMPTQTGLKLPPKPGMPTQTGLKPLTKPGLATAGLRLPTKPTIHKPGSTLSMARPSVLGTKSPTVMKAVAAATAPAATAPAAPAASAAPAQPVASDEAKTVVKPIAPAAAAAPAAVAPAPVPDVPELPSVKPTEAPKVETTLDALKSATQNLKSVTAPIPQQAILRKTGIIAEEKSDGQKQAAKSKTSRISLSEAMGAAPVLNENAPMKTIRIKRPIDIPGVAKTEVKPAETTSTSMKTVTKPAETEASTVVKATETPTEPSVSMTQRKTLKISRPSGGVMRPSGKFGIKRPGTMMTKAAKPEAAKPAGEAGAKPEDDVPEIADIPSLPTAPVPKAADGEKDLPKGVSILGILVQAAACVAMGALAWWLYTDTQILPF